MNISSPVLTSIPLPSSEGSGESSRTPKETIIAVTIVIVFLFLLCISYYYRKHIISGFANCIQYNNSKLKNFYELSPVVNSIEMTENPLYSTEDKNSIRKKGKKKKNGKQTDPEPFDVFDIP